MNVQNKNDEFVTVERIELASVSGWSHTII